MIPDNMARHAVWHGLHHHDLGPVYVLARIHVNWRHIEAGGPIDIQARLAVRKGVAIREVRMIDQNPR